MWQYPSSPREVTSPVITRWAIFILVSLFIPLLFLRNAAVAAESTEIVLVDGTVVHGTLNSLADGVYTINANTLGTLRIEAAKVKSIRAESIPGAGPEALQSLQKRMAGDAAVMDLVKSLQRDPDFQAILTDQEILRAITAGDLSSLGNNQKLMNLMNKPTVREIEQKVGQ
jgi:hypothetical protein